MFIYVISIKSSHNYFSDLDFMIGLPKEENWRCARVHPFSYLTVIKDLILTPEIYQFVKNWMTPDSLLWRSMTSLVEFRNVSIIYFFFLFMNLTYI